MVENSSGNQQIILDAPLRMGYVWCIERENEMTRKFKLTKFGLAENPVGAQIAWKVGDRHYLADVTGCFFDQVRGVTILKTRHFNGEVAPEVAASYVDVLVREFE
jgi:type III secretory pathway component EscT